MLEKKILVVDDEVGARESFRMIFKGDYTILEAKDGQEALQIFKQNKPDVILLDLIMPHINGIEVLKGVKGIDAYLPIIVVTATKNTEAGKEAMKLGAFYYVTKPFDVVELKLLVQRALEYRALAEENALLRKELNKRQ